MARTTGAEVLAIMDNCSETAANIETHFIPAANALVTEILGSDTDMGDTLKEEVERWLTAHLLASSKYRTGKQVKVGDASVTFTGAFGKFLDSTPYGQMVKTLDFTGKMASAGKRKVTIHAITSFE